jgi:uncharacterized membrane protein YkgB
MALIHDSYIITIIIIIIIIIIVLTLYCDLYLGLTGDILPSALPTKTLYSFLYSSMNAVFIGISTGLPRCSLVSKEITVLHFNLIARYPFQ